MPVPEELFSRTIMLLGPRAFQRLRESFVAVIGLGGVGSCAAEALVRAGVGKLRIVDCDTIKASDVNRQLIALGNNAGRAKVDVAAERLLAINPALTLDARQAFFHADTAAALITPDLDFVVDAIDSLSPKAELIRHCAERAIRIVSTMGAAGKTDPSRVRVAALEDTTICPLARALRRHLRSHGVTTAIPAVFSTEPPVRPHPEAPEQRPETSGTYLRGRPRRSLPSLSTIPAVFGLFAANHVIMELSEQESLGGDT